MEDQLRKERDKGKVFVNFGMLNFVYVCVCMCMHACVCPCAYVSMCIVHVRAYAYIRKYVCVVCVCICKCVHVCVHVSVCPHACIRVTDESPILFPPTYRYKTNVTNRTVEDYVWIKQKRSGVSTGGSCNCISFMYL